MKSVLISIQPYWVFLIIAKIMGWNIGKQKTVEVRKNYPKCENWDNVAKIYCSKDKRSFAKIPKEYQPLMDRFLGKVIGEFVCDEIIVAPCGEYCKIPLAEAHLDSLDLMDYADGKTVYGWHISDLKIYDKPKKLDDFHKPCEEVENCWNKAFREAGHCLDKCFDCGNRIKRPPQSWCYVEGKDDQK